MITSKQLLLARTLCGWTLKEAAVHLRMSHPNLAKYESGERVAKVDKLDFIKSVYEINGVTFTAGGGVEPRGKGILELSGRDGFAWFRQDVLSETALGNPDICVLNVDEKLFDKWGAGEVNDHYRSEMALLVASNPNLRARFLVKKGSNQFPATRHAEYRCVDSKDFGNFPFYVYGDKTALLLFEENELEIIIMSNEKITRFYRKTFNEKWSKAKSVTS